VTQAPVIDLHVHLAGVGAGGTGCWFHPERLRALPFRFMLRALGLPARQREEDLDAALRERLATSVRTAAGLDAAVVLAFDWARDAAGAPDRERSDFYVPNDYVLSLAAAVPELLPGVSIHPYRPDAVEELARCAEAGAVLVKWLPTAQNFSPADERCRPFYRELVRRGLPLLCHTGSEGATRNLDKSVNDPAVLRPALAEGVTVVAAHSGMRSGPQDRDYFETWAALLPEYPNLYGDTAALFGLRARRFLKVMDRPEVVDRLVHGSDWPVPQSPWWFAGRLGLGAILRLRRIGNPLQRDLETKRALGLPAAVFRRGARLLPAGASPG
jgi:predicted TIM-barrel fold metal-dependent hydrolase